MIIKNDNNVIKLDGENAGVLIKVIDYDTGRSRYIQNLDGSYRMFKNVDVAIATAKSIVNGNSKLIPCFKIGEMIYQYKMVQKIGNYFSIFIDDQLYKIYEDKTSTVTELSYLVFENGDTERCDKQYGVKRCNQLLKDIGSTLYLLFGSDKDSNISKIHQTNNEIIVSIKNSTGKIHILKCSKLMDINQDRKSRDERCFVFLKEMDKYTTFYVYMTKDKTEPNKVSSEEKMMNILEDLAWNLQYRYIGEDEEPTDYVNPKIAKVNFNGWINIVED